MDVKSSYGEQNHFLNQAVNLFISAANLDLLSWRLLEFDLLLKQSPSGQRRNCNFSQFCICFNLQVGMLTLDLSPWEVSLSSLRQDSLKKRKHPPTVSVRMACDCQ